MNKQVARRAALAVGIGAACAAVAQQALVPPGPNKVVFPQDWAKGVMYATVDRPDTKQYREFYSTPDVLAAMLPACR